MSEMIEELTQLKKYLPYIDVIELKLSMTLPGSLTFCLTIARIVRGYKSTQENEHVVTKLLERLCRNHFNTK